MAADHDAWAHLTFKAVNEFEEDRRDAQREIRRERKLAPPQTPLQTLLSLVDTVHSPAFPAVSHEHP